ncbi:preprotein translocase subunit SecY [Candidatus Woesearchaeota archaeon CG10_big_fil_rev_8_21_14_0_10_34_8]|nr:MAG: preprotein translocase subunit SecY [Candidatus Woesearchaeota archaeon CG10_big_fil_rev_8_21_14_0_10_34_8]
MGWKDIVMNLPEVAGPTQKKLGFKEKLKWTLIILVIFFILGIIPLFGLGDNALAQFEYLSVILGAEFGSIVSLGIGPIVTASIVLQLLNGAGIIKFDLQSPDGKRMFQGTQKLLSVGFVIFESAIYVLMGGLAPGAFFNPVTQQFTAQAISGTTIALSTAIITSLKLLLILQMTIGGISIMLMDEIVSKWGFGSGVSLFIAAGVSKSLFVRAFSWVSGPEGISGDFAYASGKIPQFFQALYNGDPQTAISAVILVVTTLVIFAIAVYIQSMKIEIPLSFGRIRGHGIRWPLSFTYANVIPVILVSALLANMQLWARLLQNWGYPILGTVSASGTATSGLVSWLYVPGGSNGLVGMIVNQGTIFIGLRPYFQTGVYMLIMIFGCMIFSYFWVQTSGMDAKTQAKNIIGSGLQIPGFRRDERILERLLERYITPLTLMGGATIGFLASAADVLGALAQGTALLLCVMIIYKLYEEIAKEHMMDMHPMLRKMME